MRKTKCAGWNMSFWKLSADASYDDFVFLSFFCWTKKQWSRPLGATPLPKIRQASGVCPPVHTGWYRERRRAIGTKARGVAWEGVFRVRSLCFSYQSNQDMEERETWHVSRRGNDEFSSFSFFPPLLNVYVTTVTSAEARTAACWVI